MKVSPCQDNPNRLRCYPITSMLDTLHTSWKFNFPYLYPTFLVFFGIYQNSTFATKHFQRDYIDEVLNFDLNFPKLKVERRDITTTSISTRTVASRGDGSVHTNSQLVDGFNLNSTKISYISLQATFCCFFAKAW